MVGSEFATKSMNPLTQPALCQLSRLVEVCNGVWNIFLVHFGPINTVNHHLNATAYSVFLLTMCICAWIQVTHFLATSSMYMNDKQRVYIQKYKNVFL